MTARFSTRGNPGAAQRADLARRQRILDNFAAADADPTLCDCGEKLAGHAPLPRVQPLHSWMSQRTSEMPWRNTMTGKTLSIEEQKRRRAVRAMNPTKPSALAAAFHIGKHR